MKQKLGLACALVQKPDYFSWMSPAWRRPHLPPELWQMVEELVDEGIGVVWSTAYLDEAEKCGHCTLAARGQTAI